MGVFCPPPIAYLQLKLRKKGQKDVLFVLKKQVLPVVTHAGWLFGSFCKYMYMYVHLLILDVEQNHYVKDFD
jgi:hypothetical protein